MISKAGLWDAFHTITSLGVNKLAERLGASRRWKYLVWSLLAANEVRGLIMTYPVWKELVA